MTQYIKKMNGTLIAVIEEDARFRTLKTPQGRSLARYDKVMDTTKRMDGYAIAKGDILTSLIDE